MINGWRSWDCFHMSRVYRGDLIEAYKILNGKDIVYKAAFFQLSPTVSTLRGHNMKLFIPGARLHVRKYFFSHRVVPHWNSLPQHVVNAPSVNSFKSRLDTWLLARYGRQMPMSFLVHQLSSSSSSKLHCIAVRVQTRSLFQNTCIVPLGRKDKPGPTVAVYRCSRVRNISLQIQSRIKTVPAYHPSTNRQSAVRARRSPDIHL